MGIWKRSRGESETQRSEQPRSRRSIPPAVHEARLWRSARLLPALEKKLGRRVRVRLALIGDPVKRERLRSQLLQREYDQLPAKTRARLESEILEGMPRRLRRAVGAKKVRRGQPMMKVPLRDAKRSRDVRAARLRGDGPGMTDPHRLWS